MKRLLQPLQEFLRLEASAGLVLMAGALLALLVANSPAATHYQSMLQEQFSLGWGRHQITLSLLLWINDALMAVFFLLVGLELKREMQEGHLATWQRAALPAIAAAGGMAVPALCYVTFNFDDPLALRGWAIPTATDIAFALGVLALLGNRVPTALKVFLLSIAIFDDLGAIVIIAIFYGHSMSWPMLGLAGLVTVALLGLNRSGVRALLPYLLLGIVLWVLVLKSGLHATLAGVILAACIPHGGVASNSREAAPLRRLEHTLHPWVAFGILPLFAFANAGLSLAGLSAASILQPVPLGVALGLFIGKQTGIVAASWLAVRLRLAALPEGVDWRQLYGVALLCGIGFTMSLFIAALAGHGVADDVFGLARLGVLVGTMLSALAGYFLLHRVLPEASRQG